MSRPIKVMGENYNSALDWCYPFCGGRKFGCFSVPVFIAVGFALRVRFLNTVGEIVVYRFGTIIAIDYCVRKMRAHVHETCRALHSCNQGLLSLLEVENSAYA